MSKSETLWEVVHLADYNREQRVAVSQDYNLAEYKADKYEQSHPEAYVVIRSIKVKK